MTIKMFNKLDIDKQKQLIEKVKYLFLEKLYTKSEIFKELKINEELFNKICNENNIKKTDEQIKLTNKRIHKKKESTMLKHYGVINNFARKDISDKIHKENKAWSDEARHKRENTMINKYGSTSMFTNEEFKKNNLKKAWSNKAREKRENTLKEKYGVSHNLQINVKDRLEKTKNTINKKYGVNHNWSIPEVKEKIQLHIIENENKKTGYNYPCQRPEVKQKIKESNEKTNLQKYGVKTTWEREDIKELIKSKLIENYGDEWYKRIQQICLDKYDVANAYLIHPNHNTVSKINIKFHDELKRQLNKDFEYEFNLNGYSYDLRYDNLLIEINPYFTHNSTIPFIHAIGKCNNINCTKHKPLDKNYHLKKLQNAQENGYRCIHVFDWDDWNKIIYLLKDKIKISGHKCELKEVSISEANNFLNKYHLQGSCKGNTVNIGLYYNNRLISLMTFGKPRYNKNYEWEFLRFANSDYIIRGGTQKLWKYFIDKYNPKSVISYSDISKFEGNFFKYLGFTFINNTKPTIHWYNKNMHFTDNIVRQLGADKLLGINYGSIDDCGLNNRDIMLKEGFVEVYDCGQAIYSYIKN